MVYFVFCFVALFMEKIAKENHVFSASFKKAKTCLMEMALAPSFFRALHRGVLCFFLSMHFSWRKSRNKIACFDFFEHKNMKKMVDFILSVDPKKVV